MIHCDTCATPMTIAWVPPELKPVSKPYQRVGIAECSCCHATFEVWVERTHDSTLDPETLKCKQNQHR
jgi:hypothetical protein